MYTLLQKRKQLIEEEKRRKNALNEEKKKRLVNITESTQAFTSIKFSINNPVSVVVIVFDPRTRGLGSILGLSEPKIYSQRLTIVATVQRCNCVT